MISSKSEEALSLDDIDINDINNINDDPSVLGAANLCSVPGLAGEISSECL